MTFDVGSVRAAYPALADGFAYLDGAAGTQVPASVIDAIGAAYRAGLGNAGGAFPASHRSTALTAECRPAVADLVGGNPDGVILGPNMTTLTYRLAYTLASQWGPGDEVVVSQLDHDANVRPWIHAAQRAGATVRWAEVDISTGELPAAQYADLLSGRTRLVAVTAASNVLGTRPEVAAITAQAREAGALSYVDGVHATPHGPVDVAALGADFYATSAYKWSGPHVGAVIADPGLLETLHPDKLMPAPDSVPERFEQGTPPFADLAGVTAAVDHLAQLAAAGPARGGSGCSPRWPRWTSTSRACSPSCRTAWPGWVMSPATGKRPAAPRPRTSRWTGARPVTSRVTWPAWASTCGAGTTTPGSRLASSGPRLDGGAVRAGLVHYNDRSDVDRLLEAAARAARGGSGCSPRWPRWKSTSRACSRSCRTAWPGWGAVTGYGKAAHRAPTAYFTVDGRARGDVARYLAGRGINVWSGHNYAWELTGILGIRDSGGAVRAGLVHYNDRCDVGRSAGHGRPRWITAGLAHGGQRAQAIGRPGTGRSSSEGGTHGRDHPLWFLPQLLRREMQDHKSAGAQLRMPPHGPLPVLRGKVPFTGVHLGGHSQPGHHASTTASRSSPSNKRALNIGIGNPAR